MSESSEPNGAAPKIDEQPAVQPTPLRSVFTDGLPAILEHFGISPAERICGVWVVNLQAGETVAFLRFEEGVQEIFAVQVLWNSRYPEMLEFGDPLINTSYVVPDEALRDVPTALRIPAA